MSLLESVTTELEDADEAIASMLSQLASVDYALGIDASSPSTPQATRTDRQALRATIARAIDTANVARALVVAQAAAVDPIALGYPAAVATVRTLIATGGNLDAAAIDGVTADVEAALTDEIGAPVVFASVRAASEAAEAGYAVDTGAVVAAELLEDAAENALSTAVVVFRAANAAIGALASNAVASSLRLGSLLELAQSALAAGRPWQAAVHLADAKAVQESLLADVNFDGSGFDADNAAADPGLQWTARAKGVLDAVADWSTPLADWASLENARIDAADQLARFSDERVVRLAQETEDALTP